MESGERWEGGRGGEGGGIFPLSSSVTSMRCLFSGGGGFSQLNVGEAEID